MIPTIDFFGQPVSKIGLGLMSVVEPGAEIYQTGVDEVSKVLDLALEKGVSFLDTADVYGGGSSERIVSAWLKGEQRNCFVICTKFALKTTAVAGEYEVHGEPEYVKAACEASLERLGVGRIDLYYQHRVDPKTPVEETMRALKALQDAGKIKHVGLSECSVETLRRAAKVVKIAAVQVEHSIFSPADKDLLDACRELGAFIVAYSPLGRGLLTTKWTSEADVPAGDFRKKLPRWQGEAFKANLRFAEQVKEIAADKGCTPAQLALAWLMAQPKCIPIPGTSKAANLEENLGAVHVVLSEADLARIQGLMETVKAEGAQYGASMLAQVGQ